MDLWNGDEFNRQTNENKKKRENIRTRSREEAERTKIKKATHSNGFLVARPLLLFLSGQKKWLETHVHYAYYASISFAVYFHHGCSTVGCSSSHFLLEFISYWLE